MVDIFQIFGICPSLKDLEQFSESEIKRITAQLQSYG